MNEKYKNELIKLINANPRSWANVLHSTYKFILDDIEKCVNQIFKFSNISTKVFCYLNDVQTYPTCAICGKQLDNLKAKVKKGFSHTCDNKECLNKYRQLQVEKSVFEKYGVKNVYSLKNTVEKTKQTKLKRHGSETYVNSAQAKQTCLKKYGVDNPAKSEEIKEKSKSTCLERYGVQYVFQSDQAKNKIKETSLRKYGVSNPGGSQQSVDKSKQTLEKHFGTMSIGKLLSTPEYKQKIKQTSLEKYGVEHYTHSKIVKRHLQESCMKKYRCSNYSTYVSYQCMLRSEFDYPLFSLADIDDGVANKELKFKCKKCGNEFTSTQTDGIHHRCPECYPKKAEISVEEKEVVAFLKEIYNGEILENTRTIIPPLELDIYIPEKKLAIEFDGLYYHKYDELANRCSNAYHLNKTELCEKQGIQLIHIFENEWAQKSTIVKSRLSSLLNVNLNTIYARKCDVRSVSSEVTRMFLIENHIQGNVNSKVNLGLYYENELVSLMTFGKSRFSKKYEWEMLRFCNKINCRVVGAAGKLLKHFERTFNPKSIVSYADRRWSKGDLYEKLDFVRIHNSSPNYWYFRTSDGILMSRIIFQKHKLNKILEKFDDDMSEVENMKMNGYSRIFDCGNIVYAKEYSTVETNENN